MDPVYQNFCRIVLSGGPVVYSTGKLTIKEQFWFFKVHWYRSFYASISFSVCFKYFVLQGLYNFVVLGVRSLANASRARQFNPLNPPGVGWVPLPQTNMAAVVGRARSVMRGRAWSVVHAWTVMRGRARSVVRGRSCTVVRAWSVIRGRARSVV